MITPPPIRRSTYDSRMTESVEVERKIAASPETVWALISDVTRMGEWSPETASCQWVGGVPRPDVGARFKGRNELGKRAWTTTCVVTDAEPGRSFGFLVKVGPLDVARWLYLIEPTDGGCRVEERWTERRNAVSKVLGRLATGVKDRAEHNRPNMEATLEQLAAVAERG